MTLERKAIRKAAVVALKGRTTAGLQVFDSPVDSFRPSVQGPCMLGVYALSDVVTEVVDSGRFYDRDLELAVELWIEEGTTGKRREDLVDDLADQVERVLAALLPRLHRVRVRGEPLEINPSESALERVEIGFDKHGRRLGAAARVVFRVRYGTEDDTSFCGELVELDGLDVSWDFAPPDYVIDARDEITETSG